MKTKRTCEHCGGEIHWAARADARFCSGRCRVAHHRATKDPVPAELRDRGRWMRHDNKRPIRVDGHPASSTNAHTWTAYATAKASTAGDGLGFALNGDGILCVDLDHCLEGGRLAPWAASILEVLPPTYIETSPSGAGLHVWGKGHVPRGRRLNVDGGGRVEIYGTGRYMTVTGRPYAGAPSRLADLSALIAQVTPH